MAVAGSCLQPSAVQCIDTAADPLFPSPHAAHLQKLSGPHAVVPYKCPSTNSDTCTGTGLIKFFEETDLRPKSSFESCESAAGEDN